MLEEGRCQSTAEIAEAEGITRSFVNRLLRLTLLAPDIQEAILDGRQQKGMQLEELTRVMAIKWGEQRISIQDCSGGAKPSSTYARSGAWAGEPD
jgi:ribosome-binding protein aMBF1 (putative translation factor)